MQGSVDPAALPLLGEEHVHLYVQEAYEGFSQDVMQAVAGRHAELVAGGMDCARHMLDWSALEPTPGSYDTQGLVEALDARVEAGVAHQFCNITVVDSFGPEALPDYVRDLLDAGVAWDDPQITGAFAELLDVVVPLMASRGVYMVGVANEPGGYYEDEPAEAASFGGFVQAAVARVHALNPALACTVVFAGAEDPAILELLSLVDVATFNCYAYAMVTQAGCQYEGYALPLLHATPAEAVGGMLDALIAVADGKLICIQEFGQSTGWDDEPETLGPQAGLVNQGEVVRALAAALDARRAHFRTVCLWTLNDHSPAGMAYLVDELIGEGLPECYANNLAEAFGPTGLVRSDVTGSKKPAFAVFKAAVGCLADGGPYPCAAPRRRPVGELRAAVTDRTW